MRRISSSGSTETSRAAGVSQLGMLGSLTYTLRGAATCAGERRCAANKAPVNLSSLLSHHFILLRPFPTKTEFHPGRHADLVTVLFRIRIPSYLWVFAHPLPAVPNAFQILLYLENINMSFRT